VLAAFIGTAFAVAGVHAWRLLRRPNDALHGAALRIALTIGALAALVQPLSGDRSAKDVTRRQPMKLAAMEAHYHTSAPAAFVVGGWPNDDARTVPGGIEIPHLLSFLAHGDANAEVKGLDQIARADWPPVRICHLAFEIMIACGTLLAAIGGLSLWLSWRRPLLLEHPRFLRLLAAVTPLGFVAIEAGWVVTEVGRQPYIIYGILRTRDALTPMPGILWPLLLTVFVYLVLTLVLVRIMTHVVRAEEAEHG
jgi:cytochrome d ubiquinol oxidase subunit I